MQKKYRRASNNPNGTDGNEIIAVNSKLNKLYE